MTRFARFAAAPALLAALSLTASPAIAAELPGSSSRSAVAADLGWDASEGQTYEQYRTYRHDRRYDRRYDPRYDRRHGRGGVDVGDILTGVLILGGIAAVASAVTDDDDRPARYPDTRYPDSRYPAQNPSYRGAETGGLDRAAAMCVERIERDTRVESVDSVDRDARGWRVTGRLYDGASFSCSIGADGRIQAIDRSDGAVGYGNQNYSAGTQVDSYGTAPVDDRQYADEAYRSAWANVEAQPAPPAPATNGDEPLPAYPGGPLPGDLEQDGTGTEYPGY